jgi:hypothetical protein
MGGGGSGGRVCQFGVDDGGREEMLTRRAEGRGCDCDIVCLSFALRLSSRDAWLLAIP